MTGSHDVGDKLELSLKVGQALFGDVVVAAATHHYGIEHPRLGQGGRATQEIPGHDLLERQAGSRGKGLALFVPHRIVRITRLKEKYLEHADW